MKYLIDSYAWIEYLNGSSIGEKVMKVLRGGEEIYSLNLIIAEVISMIERKKGNTNPAYQAIILNSKIADISSEIAREAGLFHAKMKEKIKNFGLVDSLIYIVARKLNAKILTGDEHFKRFKEAVMIK